MSQPHGNGTQQDWYTIMGLVHIGTEVVSFCLNHGNGTQEDLYTIMGRVQVGIEIVPLCLNLLEMGHNRVVTQWDRDK